MQRIIWSLLTVSLLLVASEAVAQQRAPRPSRYTPSRPTISPWLSLSRGNTGGIPSYYAWVQPQFDLERRQQFVNQQFGYVEGQMIRQNQQLQEGLIGQRGTAADAPSTAATFMNYGSFYPQAGGGNVNRSR